MFTIYHGNEAITVRAEAWQAVERYEEQGFLVARYESASYQPGLVASVTGSASLFGEDRVVVFDTPTEHDEFWQECLAMAPDLATSTLPVFALCGALTAPDQKTFTKAGVTLHESKKTAERPFNTFTLADALANRDKKSLWVLLSSATEAQVSSEEIIGVLWWQLKTLRLAELTSTASEAGIKDFPYNKAKRSLRHFTTGELERLMLSLLQVYHAGHGGERDLAEALEEWVLTL
jgi:DNA polymerase III delta subunit